MLVRRYTSVRKNQLVEERRLIHIEDIREVGPGIASTLHASMSLALAGIHTLLFFDVRTLHTFQFTNITQHCVMEPAVKLFAGQVSPPVDVGLGLGYSATRHVRVNCDIVETSGAILCTRNNEFRFSDTCQVNDFTPHLPLSHVPVHK
jgi:hypothetical protein